MRRGKKTVEYRVGGVNADGDCEEYSHYPSRFAADAGVPEMLAQYPAAFVERFVNVDPGDAVNTWGRPVGFYQDMQTIMSVHGDAASLAAGEWEVTKGNR